MVAPLQNIPEFTVSELAGSVKRTLEGAFGLVRVRGEISGLKVYASGHGYFDLKDADSGIASVIWRGNLSRLPFRPEDGLEVIATGKVSGYPKTSKYQLLVDRMEVAGVGALLKQIEDRRIRLQAEGLFDAAKKPKRPYLPDHIGVITSPSGAVIRDILHRLADRFPRRVTLWPVPVQGEAAAAAIAAAIAGFNAVPGTGRPDLLIVARGGGSVEDLMAFNDEAVVRAAAASSIPLISAVGHETDTTLIDFAAALRAPTPTAAAELAVPVRAELVEQVAAMALAVVRSERRGRALARERLGQLAARLPRASALLGMPRQRLDDVGGRLGTALAAGVAVQRNRLDALSVRLQPRLLWQRLASERARLSAPAVNPSLALLQARVARARDRVESVYRLAASLSPDAVLKRGYALVLAPDGGLVTHAAQARGHALLTLRFDDGELAVQPAAGPNPTQGRLFE